MRRNSCQLRGGFCALTRREALLAGTTLPRKDTQAFAQNVDKELSTFCILPQYVRGILWGPPEPLFKEATGWQKSFGFKVTQLKANGKSRMLTDSWLREQKNYQMWLRSGIISVQSCRMLPCYSHEDGRPSRQQILM